MSDTKKTTKKTVKKAVSAVKKVTRSEEAKKYMQLMADYEAKNPEKFALKKARMEAHLKTL